MQWVPEVSVVLATYNRRASVQRLLSQLADQTLPPARFEVVVIDDGSIEPVAEALEAMRVPFVLRVVVQPNGGPARARHRGIESARGEVIVIVDDDMQVGPDFLERHLELHPPGSRHAVLGWIRQDAAMALPVFERFHACNLERFAADARAGRIALQGTDVATGNVSFRRADYLAVGGFDPGLQRSEDAELGVRLQKSGVTLKFSADASVVHSTDHTSLATWMRRAYMYGMADLQIARKHPDMASANPWRFFAAAHPLSRVLMFCSVTMPPVMHLCSHAGMAVALGMDRLNAGRLAVAATTAAYAMEYFRGVRHESGSLRAAFGGYRHYNALRQAEARS